MRGVRLWLWTGAVMVIIQVMLGGITRLTESGLSITEWDVVMGSFPPVNSTDWQREFDAYKASAQFQKINSDFTVQQFKNIYWWEFIHRLWARLIGFVFLIPFIYFLVRKKFNGEWIRKLLFIFILGGLQGFVGWVMVASGLEGDPWVDPSKLTIHLLLALLVFIMLVYYALSYREEDLISDHPVANRSIKWIIAIILIQITLGGLMAGTDAARIYNTWPFMNGKFAPEGLFHHVFSAEKLTQLTPEINFLHRNFAIVAALAIIGFWWQNRKYSSALVHRLNSAILILVIIQFILGVITLLGSKINIPVFLGVMHQLTACILLGVSIAILYFTKNRKGVHLTTGK